MKSLFRYGFFILIATVTSCGSDDYDGGPNELDTSIIPTEGSDSPLTYDGMNLVWQEEFDGPSINLNNWTYEVGNNNGWGNNELQTYTLDNARILEGNLVITAERDGSQYKSSRMVTQGKQSFQYGRVDIRAALPQGQGMWPALWMLGSNFSTVGWPRCGEIDIMEMVGGAGRENTVHGTLHWSGLTGAFENFGRPYIKPSGSFHGQYHVFSIIWDENSIRWLVDDVQYNVIDITSDALIDEFRNDFFFIVNLAVGGNWPGAPNGSTSFPQHFVIDYIRVFQEN